MKKSCLMHGKILILVVVTLIVASNAAFGALIEPLYPGTKIEATKFKDTNGKEWTIPPPKGTKAVVMAFWTPKSRESVTQLKELAKLVATRSDVMAIAITKGNELAANSKESYTLVATRSDEMEIAVARGNGSAAKSKVNYTKEMNDAVETMEKEGIKLPLVFDAGSNFASTFKVSSVPAFFLLDESGYTVAQELSSITGKVRNHTFGAILDRVRDGNDVPLIEATPVDWQNEKENRALIGWHAPEFSMKDTEGNVRSIKSYEGRTLILVFWSPNCPHCTRELPRLAEFIKSYGKKKNAAILSIAGDDKADVVKKILKSAKANFPVILDKDRSLYKFYHVRSVPVIYIVNDIGIVEDEIRGEHPWIGGILKSAIANPINPQGTLCGRPLKIFTNYGPRRAPTKGAAANHSGIDVSTAHGQQICAAGDGVVVSAGYQRGYGNTVIINHDGGLTTLYAHGLRVLVTKNQIVHQGERIMLADCTGICTSSHLHFEKRLNGVAVDPFVKNAAPSFELVDYKVPLHTYPNPWRKGNNDICFNVGDVLWDRNTALLIVSVSIFDIRGKLVRKIEKTWNSPDEMTGPAADGGKATKNLACWDVSDKDGMPVESGAYTYKLHLTAVISGEKGEKPEIKTTASGSKEYITKGGGISFYNHEGKISVVR